MREGKVDPKLFGSERGGNGTKRDCRNKEAFLRR
jgi:hypothetical protein